jgi:RNA polymerase sigma-70 factor (ECF subfamily)
MTERIMTEGPPLLHRTDGTPVEPASEGTLLERHRMGDREAFAALVAEYRAPVYGYLTRCGVEAGDRDDLFQDAFLRIHRAAARYDAGRSLHAWVFTIVANVVRNHFRRRRVRQLADGGAPPGEVPDPAPDGVRRTEARQAARWLEEQIRRLPVGQRQVLLLACVESLPLAEVARALEVPLNTVKTRLRRARLRLIEARRERAEPWALLEPDAERREEPS